jgi:hypothetical protein
MPWKPRYNEADARAAITGAESWRAVLHSLGVGYHGKNINTLRIDSGISAVGRKYGVSDNAIRKWLREFERERLLARGRDPSVPEIPRRTWPNRRRESDDAAA